MQRMQSNLTLAYMSAVPGPNILSLDNRTSKHLLAAAVSHYSNIERISGVEDYACYNLLIMNRTG